MEAEEEPTPQNKQRIPKPTIGDALTTIQGRKAQREDAGTERQARANRSEPGSKGSRRNNGKGELDKNAPRKRATETGKRKKDAVREERSRGARQARNQEARKTIKKGKDDREARKRVAGEKREGGKGRPKCKEKAGRRRKRGGTTTTKTNHKKRTRKKKVMRQGQPPKTRSQGGTASTPDSRRETTQKETKGQNKAESKRTQRHRPNRPHHERSEATKQKQERADPQTGGTNDKEQTCRKTAKRPIPGQNKRQDQGEPSKTKRILDNKPEKSEAQREETNHHQDRKGERAREDNPESQGQRGTRA